jgi:hypothetical protein
MDLTQEAIDSILPRTERYTVRQLLGSGSMGMVFRVFDREDGREVALKTLRSPNPEDLYLLKREFRALAKITHRHLVQLYNLEVEETWGFFTMEWIRGSDLLTGLCKVPRAPARDYDEVRDVFGQLVQGLAVLHARGILHRDVKPMNVLIENGGRVVLLDFGLALGIERALSLASQDQGFAGTLLYTSPEQAWGQRISPAADFYSVGVMLYECLTGRLPFEGPTLGGLLDRKQRTPRSVRSSVPEVPADLDELAMALLHHEPELRPTADELIAVLQGGRDGAALQSGTSPPGAGTVFMGRKAELAALREAFASVRSGRSMLVRIEGPSGIGKTTLVERFLEEVEAKDQALVLRSRCHPNESIRFEAFDGIVDDLSRYLLHEPVERVEALRPRGVRALVRVFSVLGRVPFAALGSEPDPSDADPQEVRRRAFAALRELLARIADRRPLVLWIDDLHWADLDSAPVLRELLREPDPPALLLIATHRSEDRERSPLLGALAEAEGKLGATRVLAVPPLDPDETDALLASLLASAPAATLRATREVAADAGGSPFLVGELARFIAECGQHGQVTPARTSIDLGAVISGRIKALPDTARDLLELVAVAGRPIEWNLLLDAVGSSGRGRPWLYELCNDSLLRAVPPRGWLEPYHARLREAVLANLDTEVCRTRHRQLATALAARPGSDPADLLEHLLGAGDEAAAAPYALAAAQQAEATLAFDRAAELYELASRLLGSRERDVELLERRARALANAGRGSAAALGYRRAAVAAERGGRRDHLPAALRGRAAVQHFYASELAQGTDLLRGVLRDLGVRLPANRRAALRSALLLRLRFLARGTRFTPCPSSLVPPSTRERLEILQGAARGVSMLEPTLSSVLMARHLLEALGAGDVSHASRAIALEAGFEACIGGRWLRRRGERLLRWATELTEFSGDPYDRAWLELCRSNTAWFVGAWRECVDRGERAVRMLGALGIGTNWELAANHAFTLSALVQLGRLHVLSTRLPELIAEARARGDRYALTVYRTGDGVFSQLRADDPERARSEMEPTEAWSGGDFLSHHFHHLVGRVNVDLYAGLATPAFERVEETWPALRQAGFLRMDCIGIGLRHLRGRAAIAAALEARSRGQAGVANRLAGLARSEARRIAHSSLTHAPALSSALLAGASASSGDTARCVEQLEAALSAFEGCEMRLYVESARWQLGRLRGGAEGGAGLKQAESWMAEERIQNPAAMVRLAMPVG